MMPEYTDEQMRERCADDGGLAEYHDPIDGWRQVGELRKEFDRWLAGVRAEAAAAALETAANETISVAYSASTNGPAEYRDQPVLDAAVRKWLNARADVIRASVPEGEHTEPTGGQA